MRRFITLGFVTGLIVMQGLLIAPPILAEDPILAQIDGADGGAGEVEFNFEGQQITEDQAKGIMAALAAFTGVLMVIGLILFVVQIVLMVMNYQAASSIPPEHQQMNPALVFLFLVPCLNIVMFFIAFTKIPNGFQSYFNSIGRTDVGDCGSGLGIGTAICLLLIAPVGFVLWIILTLKFNGYKQEIEGAA